MTDAARPRAPWYAAATRRIALVRVGLPTLLACVAAIGPGAALRAPSLAAQDAAALVGQASNGTSSVLNGHRDGRRGDGGGGTDDATDDVR